MIDAINLDPAQVKWINSYNNDLINGARIDAATGRTWINPVTKTPYSIAPLQFESLPPGTSPAWSPIIAGKHAGKSAIVFSKNSTFFDPKNPQGLGYLLAYLSHEGDHYTNGIKFFQQLEGLKKSLVDDKNLTPTQKVTILSGLIAEQEGRGIVANYEASKVYAGLGGNQKINVPLLAYQSLETPDLKSMLDNVPFADKNALIDLATRFNSEYNRFSMDGVVSPYFLKQKSQAQQVLSIQLTSEEAEKIPKTVTRVLPDGSFSVTSGRLHDSLLLS